MLVLPYQLHYCIINIKLMCSSGRRSAALRLPRLWCLLLLCLLAPSLPSSSSSSSPSSGAAPRQRLKSPPFKNAWCRDAHFRATFDSPALPATAFPTPDALREDYGNNAGWQRLAAAATDGNTDWGVCPCHNAGFTASAEQWDGYPRTGMASVTSECYFSVPECAPYFKRGNCPGASPAVAGYANATASTGTTAPRILVATTVPYTAAQISNRQAGLCAAKCEFVQARQDAGDGSSSGGGGVWRVPSSLADLTTYDGVVWPLDWSYGGAATMPVPNAEQLSQMRAANPGWRRADQMWFAFTEEEMFKAEGGRPDLWQNRTFISRFDRTATYDYASADLPFNLWRFHFLGPCTANAYFSRTPVERTTTDPKGPGDVLADRDDLTAAWRGTPPFVSYISRNCRGQRDDWVRTLHKLVPVAGLGKCLHNTDWPFPKATYPYWQEKVRVLRRYPFTLAIEGSDMPGRSGLVSEKLFDAFVAGTVPIYWGAPRHVVEPLAPSPESFIHVDDFPSLEALAARLTYLGEHPDEYLRAHHAWRTRAPDWARFCPLLETNINTLACRICEEVVEKKRRQREEEAKRDTAPTESIPSSPPQPPPPTTTTHSPVTIEVGIKSAPERQEQRDALRDTWMAGMATGNGTVRVRARFLVELPAQEHMAARVTLAKESMAHGNDIVLYSPPSNTAAATNSAAAVLGFSRLLVQQQQRESQSRIGFDYALVCDDDVMPAGLLSMGRALAGAEPRPKLYMGHVSEYAGPQGVAVPATDPDSDVELLPPFADARAYLLSSDVVAWLGSDTVFPMLGSVNVEGEGPSLASWLLLIQVHAQHGVAVVRRAVDGCDSRVCAGVSEGGGVEDVQWIRSITWDADAAYDGRAFAVAGLIRPDMVRSFWQSCGTACM